MSEVPPAARARTFSYPAYGPSASKTHVNALAIAAPEAIDARETAELEFELARLLRIVGVNRHAETEE